MRVSCALFQYIREIEEGFKPTTSQTGTGNTTRTTACVVIVEIVIIIEAGQRRETKLLLRRLMQEIVSVLFLTFVMRSLVFPRSITPAWKLKKKRQMGRRRDAKPHPVIDMKTNSTEA